MLNNFVVDDQKILRNQFVTLPDGEITTVKEIWPDFILLEKEDGSCMKLKVKDFYHLHPDNEGGWNLQ
jgi:hypothetical protein